MKPLDDQFRDMINGIIIDLFPDVDMDILEKHTVRPSRLDGYDYQSPIAFQLAKHIGTHPHVIATQIKNELDHRMLVERTILS